MQEPLPRHRAQVLDIARRHGVSRVRVFGSYARGEAGADSDIDLLVDVACPTSAWFPAGLALELEALLGRTVDVVTEPALHPFIREKVLQEAVEL
jgi:predicted nucleotidyltransferase